RIGRGHWRQTDSARRGLVTNPLRLGKRSIGFSVVPYSSGMSWSKQTRTFGSLVRFQSPSIGSPSCPTKTSRSLLIPQKRKSRLIELSSPPIKRRPKHEPVAFIPYERNTPARLPFLAALHAHQAPRIAT